MRARSCRRRHMPGGGAQHLRCALPLQPRDPLVHLVEQVRHTLPHAVEDDRRPSSASTASRSLTSSGFANSIGERAFDAHRHRLDLPGQRGVFGAEVVAVGTLGPRSRRAPARGSVPPNAGCSPEKACTPSRPQSSISLCAVGSSATRRCTSSSRGRSYGPCRNASRRTNPRAPRASPTRAGLLTERAPSLSHASTRSQGRRFGGAASLLLRRRLHWRVGVDAARAKPWKRPAHPPASQDRRGAWCSRTGRSPSPGRRAPGISQTPPHPDGHAADARPLRRMRRSSQVMVPAQNIRSCVARSLPRIPASSRHKERRRARSQIRATRKGRQSTRRRSPWCFAIGASRHVRPVTHAAPPDNPRASTVRLKLTARFVRAV